MMRIRLILIIAVVALTAPVLGQGSDLWMADTPTDTGQEPNPDTGPMWVTEDIWVRSTPEPNHSPLPFNEASPSWTPLGHENPEYRDPLFSTPNYVYIRVRNRGTAASSGTEELHLYWTKASTGLAWDAQWVDNVVVTGGERLLFGAEVTKERKNAATATPAERDAYVQAVLAIGTDPSFQFPGGQSYFHTQDAIHERTASGPGGSFAFGHQAPDFLPWHREMINRYELLLQAYDPTVKLLYWDWTTNPTSLFTSTFMGASGAGTGGAPIGAPFGVSLAPQVRRNLSPLSIDPDRDSDPNRDLLGIPQYHFLLPTNNQTRGFRDRLEFPRHNSAHGYIGGSMLDPAAAAQDPFFFLVHTNVDRLWAEWQRDPAMLSRLNRAQAYGFEATHGAITRSMAPWNGGSNLAPWTTAGGQIVNKDSLHPSVVFPPIYDRAPLNIPVLQPGEAVIIEIPWYPPNPADFAAFGDQNHFCLLARIETAPNGGMAFQETTDVNLNTRENNNIVWKNVTVVDNFPGALRPASILVRNVFDQPVETGLRFADVGGFEPSFFEFGRIFINLGPELFERWRAGGTAGRGIEPIGDTTLQIFSPEASIHNIVLEPNEVFPVEVRFELREDYQAIAGTLPKWDLIQVGTPEDPEGIVGGNRFEMDFRRLVHVAAGSEWRYFDEGPAPRGEWWSLDYDDTSWKLGRANLGFGHDPVTVIDGGPPENRRLTTYFRTSFEVADPGIVRTLYLQLQRNDGAAVYLNGQEVARFNLPEGALAPDTLATSDVTGLERDMYFPVRLEPELLRPGTNVVAGEVHLASETSADLSFDLELFSNPADERFPPRASFASIDEGALFQLGDAIEIDAEALDPDGRIAAVSFFVDGELLGTADEPPYVVRWDDASPGLHQLRIVAADDDQQQVTVDTRVTVVENTPPVISLELPGGGMFRAGDAVPVSVQATDPGGRVERVEFHLKGMERFDDPDVVVGVAEEEPFEITLTDVEPGMYMLYAFAVDDGGVMSQSIPVHLHIME